MLETTRSMTGLGVRLRSFLTLSLVVLLPHVVAGEEETEKKKDGSTASISSLRRELSQLSRQSLEPAKLGRPAPNFRLPLLTDSEVPDWVPVEGKETRKLRLTAFRDKRPVVLIFGSYT